MISAKVLSRWSLTPPCRSSFTASHPLHRSPYPLADSQPYNFLNLDFYAQDTWKLTRKFTWTFGIRDTYNSNPLNPHNAVARLAGSFDSISHDVNQPLEPSHSNVIRAPSSRPRQPPSCSPGPLSHGSSRRTPYCAADSDSSATSCRAASSILWGRILLIPRHFRADCSAAVGGVASHREYRTAPSMLLRRPISFSIPALRKGSSPAHRHWPIPIPAFRRFPSPPFPTANCTRLTSCSGAFALEQQAGDTLNLRAQYVGTRAVNQPYETQVNGYQTVCHGCFAPFPYGQPTDPRFGAGNAIEHRREQPLQRPPVNRR